MRRRSRRVQRLYKPAVNSKPQYTCLKRGRTHPPLVEEKDPYKCHVSHQSRKTWDATPEKEWKTRKKNSSKYKKQKEIRNYPRGLTPANQRACLSWNTVRQVCWTVCSYWLKAGWGRFCCTTPPAQACYINNYINILTKVGLKEKSQHIRLESGWQYWQAAIGLKIQDQHRLHQPAASVHKKGPLQ